MATSDQKRPARIRLPDFAGRPMTLSDSAECWRLLPTAGKAGPSAILLLGMGPYASSLPSIPHDADIYWLEAPQTLAALQAGAHTPKNRPQKWQKVNLEEALALSRTCQTWYYQPAMRLAPDFWGPLLAALEVDGIQLAQENIINPHPKTAWLPGSPHQLLHTEIKSALADMGYSRIHEGICAQYSTQRILDLWENSPPRLAISINFRGLDSEGRIFYLCREMKIPLFIWLVDNPWHILSAIRFPWWREANIFVTDASFLQSMCEYGAKSVKPLPLAVAPHMWSETIQDKPSLPPLFIGRSAFPGKDSYFRGIRLPPALCEMANDMANPDWHWWSKQLGVQLWPGLTGRCPGFGAETCSAGKRAEWIGAALPRGLEIIGDAGWREFFANAKTHGPVDYYDTLPEIYNKSEAILNVTSLLLPESLNQRHFDVWAAGGLLLGPCTKGLEIFPRELAEAMILQNPADFGTRLAWFKKNPAARNDLITGWRETLKNGHSYKDRILHMLRGE